MDSASSKTYMYIDFTHVDQLITASIYKPNIFVIYVYLWYIEFVSVIFSKICSLEIEMDNTNNFRNNCKRFLILRGSVKLVFSCLDAIK